MSRPTEKIWIDVTDLSSWKGHLTGTQRVAFEIAKRFHESSPDKVAFFVYDEKSHNFYETPFSPVMEQVNPKVVDPLTIRQLHGPSVKGVVKAQSLRAYHNLPFRIKQQLTPERRELIKKTYRRTNDLARNARSPRSNIIKAAVKNSGPLIFQRDDHVVILGKPWDTMSFIDVLRMQKLEQGFKITHLIYDMIPAFLPHLFGQPLPVDYTTYMFEAISLADRLIAISESTKKDIIKFCHEQLLPTPEITVIKLADTSFMDAVDDSKETPLELQNGGFVLCVGTVEVRKNHILLYTAYREAALTGKKLPKLVIVGGKGWYTTDVLYEFRHDPVLKDSVHIMHKTNDAQLAWLYKHCAFTVYPSVYEGWGLPVAESLAYGKMCISSDTSSMPEIAGSLIEYFSPYDSQECLRLLEKYTDKNLLEEKEAAIRATYKPVTWDQTFEQVARIVAA